MNSLFKFLALALFITLSGCSSTINLNLKENSQTLSYVDFRKSENNKYAIVIKGNTYSIERDSLTINELVGDLPADAKEIPDAYLVADIKEITKLLKFKGYDVYSAKNINEFYTLIRLIEKESLTLKDPSDIPKLFIAYSGEGNKEGLNIRSFIVNSTTVLSYAGDRLKVKDVIDSLRTVNAKKLLLLNACESGTFIDIIKRDNLEYRGVIISACDVGFSTTPCESAGHSALYASLLELYESDPNIEINLADPGFTKVGRFINNYRHIWVDFWNRSGLPISYRPVIFFTDAFKL